MAVAIDEARLDEFMGRVVADMGAMISAPLMVIGERLGLYKAMAGAGPLSSTELADRTGVAERSVREWVATKRPAGISTTTLRATVTSCRRSKPWRWPTKKSGVRAWRVRSDRVDLRRRGQDPQRVQEWRRDGWHEHDHRLFLGTDGSSARATRLISFPSGFRRSRVSRRSSNGARRSPMSAVATAPRRSSWRRHFRTPSSTGSTTTTPQSNRHANAQPTPVSATESRSRLLQPKTSPVRTTTSSVSSTASTTWAIRSELPRISARRLPQTGPG